MNDVPVRDPDDHSFRVYPYDGELENTVYRLTVTNAATTGSIRYFLAVRNFTFKSQKPDCGDELPPPPLGPIMLISPENIRFPDTLVNGNSPPETMGIANVGNAPLNIDTMILSSFGWQIFDADNTAEPPNLPLDIEPGSSKFFLLNFFPTAPAGEKTGSLTITANVPTSPRIVGLSGLAVDTNPPPPLQPDWLWLGGYAPSKTSSFQSLPIQLPQMQAGDLALICVTWRNGERWNIPAGWTVQFEANDSLVSVGSRASNLILTRVIQAGDPLSFSMTPRLGNSAIPFAMAFCVGWRPRNGVPRFVAVSSQDSDTAQLPFEAPSLDIQNPHSLIFCCASMGTYENRSIYPLQPFRALGLSALPSIPMYSNEVEDPNAWQWSHLAHAANNGASTTLSMELYGLDRVPAGPTGKFVGKAVIPGQHRLVAIAFDGPT